MMITILPESPKYLYANNKFDAARSSLYYIAKVNKSKHVEQIKQITFDSENPLNGGEGGSQLASMKKNENMLIENKTSEENGENED